MLDIKRVAIVWESKTGGGVNSYLKYLLQSKAFVDKQITIFTNSENKGAKLLIKDFEKQKNIKFIFFKSFFVFDRQRIFLEKLIYYFLKPLFLVGAVFKFRKLLSNFSFDVLLCECGNYGHFRSEQAAIIASKSLKIPVKIIVVHHACEKPPLFMGLVFNIIDYFLTRTLSSLISVSEATRKTLFYNSNLINNDRLKGYVIHNGVPVNKFPKKDYLNLKFDNNNMSTLKIGMISRLSPDKGHEILIKAFSKLPLEYQKKMIAVIVGEDEGDEKSKLKNLVSNLNLENKIKFLDYVDLDSKKIILSLDLLLSLTKSYEGFGLSIAEAMSVGIPVLATDVGGVNEFFNNECGKLIKLSNNDCGKLIKSEQIEEIKNSLIDFCDHKKDWENKAQIAKNKIEKYFNSEIMGTNYMNHFISRFEEIK